jgi:hypothetical protein
MRCARRRRYKPAACAGVASAGAHSVKRGTRALSQLYIVFQHFWQTA